MKCSASIPVCGRPTVVPAGPSFQGQAADLARRLDLPLAHTPPANAALVLLVDAQGPGLPIPGSRMRPVRVAFFSRRIRRRGQATGREAIVRAVGAAKRRNLCILDATAGLGRDAFILACHGCTVHLAERNAILAAMLADGIARLKQTEEGQAIARRLHLMLGDALDLLARPAAGRPAYDCIYLDPLFPERSKSALVKKEMRIVRLLTSSGGDPAADSQLLAAALAAGSPRVVVKRPRLAPPLAGVRPDLQLAGRASRFDIYLRPS